MNLKNLKLKPGRFIRFTRPESFVKWWPLQWLAKTKILTLSLRRKKGGAEMNGKKIMAQRNKDCEAHEEHLCYIISQGFHLSDEQSYMALITSPKFRCGHCGRQTASYRNLCIPMDL
jgi:DNA-directed RNA polymerase subunit M/transcription elongation factor TFIIS